MPWGEVCLEVVEQAVQIDGLVVLLLGRYDPPAPELLKTPKHLLFMAPASRLERGELPSGPALTGWGIGDVLSGLHCVQQGSEPALMPFEGILGGQARIQVLLVFWVGAGGDRRWSQVAREVTWALAPTFRCRGRSGILGRFGLCGGGNMHEACQGDGAASCQVGRGESACHLRVMRS